MLAVWRRYFPLLSEEGLSVAVGDKRRFWAGRGPLSALTMGVAGGHSAFV